MTQVNILEAKTTLSKLISLLETQQEEYITIARNGTPVARLVPLCEKSESRRIGIARGLLSCPEDLDWCNDEIAEEFNGGSL